MEWRAREGRSTPGEENDKVGREGEEGVKVNGTWEKKGGKGVAILHHSALLATFHPDPSWEMGIREGDQEVGSMEVGSTHTRRVRKGRLFGWLGRRRGK